jgi:hypothetical protein
MVGCYVCHVHLIRLAHFGGLLATTDNCVAYCHSMLEFPNHEIADETMNILNIRLEQVTFITDNEVCHIYS